MQRLIWIGIAAATVASSCGPAQTPSNAAPSPTPAAATASARPASPSPSESGPLKTTVASPVASPIAIATVADFGAQTPLFSDQFDDPGSGWGTGSTQGGEVQYLDGALVFNVAGESNWLWSTRPLATAESVVRVEGLFTPSAGGYQGLLCADSDELMYGAVANAEGRWAFITLTDVRADLLTTQEHPAWAITPQESTRIALDCAGTATGSFRMQLSLPDRGLAAHYNDTGAGPASLDLVGIYGEAAAAEYSLGVDDFSAFAGSDTAP